MLQEFSIDRRVIEAVQHEVEWSIRDGRSPQDTWCGEAVFASEKGNPPKVIFYTDTVATRMPTRRAFEVVVQGTVDHMFGHLGPYFGTNGEGDYGEEVACRLQWLAARSRPGFDWRLAERFLPWVYNSHKEINRRNYRQ